ncbi:MAG: RNA recognition motif-containing protein [Gammaproteobacteria bacterium]|jgi:RNA recognition motif-containing protein
MNIYCGNLAYSMTSDSLRAAFEAHGEVSSANVITDRDTGRSKGFGFVEMPNDTEGQAAIDGVNGADLEGRPARVNEARPRPEGGGGGGGGGRPPPRY